MILYKTPTLNEKLAVVLIVMLDNRRIGTINKTALDEDNQYKFQYVIKGQPIGGEIFNTVREVKESLEAD